MPNTDQELVDAYFGDNKDYNALADAYFSNYAKPLPAPTPPKSSLLRRAADIPLGLLSSTTTVPEAAVGLADMVTGGHAGKVAESIGFRPQEAREIINSWKSPELQEAQQKVQDAKGFIPTITTMVANPSTILDSAAESSASMIGAGALGRGLLRIAPKALGSAANAIGRLTGAEIDAGTVAAGLGEGAFSAGTGAEQVRQQSSDGLLTGKQALTQAASGLGVGMLGMGGGIAGAKIGKKLGIDVADIDSAIVNGRLSQGQGNALKRIGTGMLTEGMLEELPQSALEQVSQNVALGKQWNEGVPEAAASGMLVGAAMGAGSNIMSRHGGEAQTPPDQVAMNDTPIAPVTPPTQPTQSEPIVVPPAVASPSTAVEDTPVAPSSSTAQQEDIINPEQRAQEAKAAGAGVLQSAMASVDPAVLPEVANSEDVAKQNEEARKHADATPDIANKISTQNAAVATTEAKAAKTIADANDKIAELESTRAESGRGDEKKAAIVAEKAKIESVKEDVTVAIHKRDLAVRDLEEHVANAPVTQPVVADTTSATSNNQSMLSSKESTSQPVEPIIQTSLPKFQQTNIERVVSKLGSMEAVDKKYQDRTDDVANYAKQVAMQLYQPKIEVTQSGTEENTGGYSTNVSSQLPTPEPTAATGVYGSSGTASMVQDATSGIGTDTKKGVANNGVQPVPEEGVQGQTPMPTVWKQDEVIPQPESEVIPNVKQEASTTNTEGQAVPNQRGQEGLLSNVAPEVAAQDVSTTVPTATVLPKNEKGITAKASVNENDPDWIQGKLHGDINAAIRFVAKTWDANAENKLKTQISNIPSEELVFISQPSTSQKNVQPLALATMLADKFKGQVVRGEDYFIPSHELEAKNIKKGQRVFNPPVYNGRNLEKLKDKSVVIVDDVFTTGGSAGALSRELSRNGINVVTYAGIAGDSRIAIDPQTRSKLISSLKQANLPFKIDSLTNVLTRNEAHSIIEHIQRSKNNANELSQLTGNIQRVLNSRTLGNSGYEDVSQTADRYRQEQDNSNGRPEQGIQVKSGNESTNFEATNPALGTSTFATDNNVKPNPQPLTQQENTKAVNTKSQAKPKNGKKPLRNLFSDIKQLGGIKLSHLKNMLDTNEIRGGKGKGNRYITITGKEATAAGLDQMAQSMRDLGWNVPLDVDGRVDANGFAQMLMTHRNDAPAKHPDNAEAIAEQEWKAYEKELAERVEAYQKELESTLEEENDTEQGVERGTSGTTTRSENESARESNSHQESERRTEKIDESGWEQEVGIEGTKKQVQFGDKKVYGRRVGLSEFMDNFTPDPQQDLFGKQTTKPKPPPTDAEVQQMIDDGDIPFSRGKSIPSGVSLTVAELEEYAKQFVSGKNVPGVIVKQRVSDLPFPAPNNVKGALFGGNIYLLADTITSTVDANRTIAHEFIGHFGLRGFFGDKINPALNDIFKHNITIQKYSAEWIDNNVDVIKEQGLNSKEIRYRSIEEAMARMAEEGKNFSYAHRLIRMVQQLLRAIGLHQWANSLESKTNAEALQMLRKSELYIKYGISESSAIPEPLYPLFLTAWHGSPHDHNKFDSSKIGTGEGAQAYGYGLYFAGAREVAEHYKNVLGRQSIVPMDILEKYFQPGRIVNGYGGLDKVVSFNKGTKPFGWSVTVYGVDKDGNRTERNNRTHATMPKWGEVEKATGEKPGKLYEVELAPKEDEYLLWNKPLSEQSEKVKAAIGKFELFQHALKVENDWSPTGMQIYKYATTTNGNNDKAASDYLHSLGIRGIKYLDGSSRVWGQHSYNYVIFNDADVSITNKYSRTAAPIDHPDNTRSIQPEIVGDASTTKSQYVSSSDLADIAKSENITFVEAKGELTDSIRKLGEIFGQEVVFYRDNAETDTGSTRAVRTSGFVTGNSNEKTIFINAESGYSPGFVFAHELTHQLKFQFKEEYRVLGKQILDLVYGKDFLDRIDTLQQERNISKEAAFDEFLANVVGERFVQPDFWRKMSVEKPTLFERIAQIAIDIMRKVKNSVKEVFSESSLIRDIDKAETAILDAMNVMSEGNRFSKSYAPVENAHESKASLSTAFQKIVNWKALERTGNFHIVQTAQELPEGVKASDVKGVVTKDGQVYFVANQIAKSTETAILMHEIGNHYGLENMLGKELFAAVMKQTETLKATSKSVQEAYKLVPKDTKAELVNEEALGYLAEINPQHGIIRRILGAIKAFLFKHGILQAKHLKEADLMALLKASLNRVSREATTQEMQARQFESAMTSREQAQHEKEYKDIEAKYWNADGTPKPGAQLAPNGEKSNLNKHQWIQVRTESFKKWFGDWEQQASSKLFADKLSNWGSFNRNDYAEIGVMPDVLLKLGLRNLPLRINQATLKKVLNPSGISGGKHGKISLYDLQQLPDKIAAPIMVFDSKTHPGKSIVIMTELVDADGDTVIAALHIEKQQGAHIVHNIASVYGKDSNNFFVNEINNGRLKYIDIQKSLDWSQSRGLQLPSESDIKALSTSNLLFRSDVVNQNSVSKVVDANGEPMVVYHGTDADFTSFKTGKTKQDNEIPFGSHFTAKPEMANIHANGYIMPVFLNIKNILDLNENDYPAKGSKESEIYNSLIAKNKHESKYSENYIASQRDGQLRAPLEIELNATRGDTGRKTIIEHGYDGVVYDARYYNDPFGATLPERDTSFVAISPSQIKSATGNTGEFSSNNNDIRYSVASNNNVQTEVLEELTGNKDTTISVKDLQVLAQVGNRIGTKLEAMEVKGENSDAIRKIGQLFRKRIVFFKGRTDSGEKFDKINGFVRPDAQGVVFLNVESNNSLFWTVGHEAGHLLELDTPEAYKQLLKQLLPYIDSAKYATYKNILVENNLYKNMDDTSLYKEFVGNAIGELFTAPNVWSTMAKENPSLFKKVADAVMKVINKIKTLMMDKNKASDVFNDVAMANRIIVDAMKTYAESNKNTDNDSTDVKYSVASDAIAAARERLATHATGVMNRIQNWIQQPGRLGALPDANKYLIGRYKTLGDLAKIKDESHAIFNIFAKANKETSKAVYEYLTNKDADINSVPEAYRTQTAAAKQKLISIGDKLVTLGMLKPETFEANKGQYLPRVYLKYIVGEEAARMLGGGKRLDLAYLKQRKDIPEDVRRLILGEIKDPGYLLAKAISTPMRDMALINWLSDIATNDEWVLPKSLVKWQATGDSEVKKVTPYYLKSEADRLEMQAEIMPEEDRAEATELVRRMRATANAALEVLPINPEDVPAGFKQLPNSAKYGQLKGLIIRKEIFNDIVGNANFSLGDNSMAEKILGTGGTVSKVTGWWKWSKVAANPPAQVRNFVSNMVLLHLSGISMHKVPQRLYQAALEMKNNGANWKLAKEYGVTESSFANTEMIRIRDEFIELIAKNQEGATGWQAVRNFAYKYGAMVVNKTGDMYQLVESLGKVAKIIDMRDKGATVEDAVLEAHKALFDYSLVNPNIRYLRNAPIGVPFITFATKIAPRLLDTAINHPARFAPYVAMAYGMQYLVAAMTGIDDDDLDKIKQALPEWIQDKQHTYLLPWKDDKGRWQAVDVGYFFPWTQWTEMLSNIGQGEIKKAFQATGIFGGPLPDLIAAVKTNTDPFTKRPIMDKYGSPSEQTGQIFGYLYQMAMPPWLTQRGVAGKVKSALSAEVDKYGLPKATGKQVALSAIGMNVYGYDASLTRKQNIERMNNEIKEVKRQMTSEMKDKNNTPEKRVAIRQKYLERMQKMNTKRVEYIKSSLPSNPQLLGRQ